jgi:hypothetical protein
MSPGTALLSRAGPRPRGAGPWRAPRGPGTAAGYIVKQKNGRRNHYQIQAHLPLPEPTSRERTVGEVLALLAGTDAGP